MLKIISRKQDLTFSANCFQMDTICMECQIFSEEEKAISKCCLLKFLPNMISINDTCF